MALGDLYTDRVHEGTVNVMGQAGFIGVVCSAIHCTPGYGALSFAFLCLADKMAGKSADQVKAKVSDTVGTVTDTCTNWAHQVRAAIPSAQTPNTFVPDSKKMS